MRRYCCERYYEISCDNGYKFHVKAKTKPRIREVFKTLKKDFKKIGVSEIFGIYEISRTEILEAEEDIPKFGY